MAGSIISSNKFHEDGWPASGMDHRHRSNRQSDFGEVMLGSISGWMRGKAKPGVVIASLILFLLFLFFVLPGQATAANSASGDAGTPDLSFFYTSQDLYRMAEAYGVEGRQEYIRTRFTFDLVWPLVYGFFFAATISWFAKKVFPQARLWQTSNLLPVSGVLLDLLENLSTSLIMYRFPARTPVIDIVAPAFTALKWILIAASFLALSLGILLSLRRKLTGDQPS
jgi:hypothetical protein